MTCDRARSGCRNTPSRPTAFAMFQVISFGGNRRCDRGKNGSPASMTALIGTVATNPDAEPARIDPRGGFMFLNDANAMPSAWAIGLQRPSLHAMLILGNQQKTTHFPGGKESHGRVRGFHSLAPSSDEPVRRLRLPL